MLERKAVSIYLIGKHRLALTAVSANLGNVSDK